MAEGFTKETLKMVVSQVCQTIGWHAIQTTSLEVLVDVLHRYLEEVAKTAHLYADQFGRTRPNLDDLGLAFSAMGIEIRELEEYIQYVESVPCAYQVPKYPVQKESHLNFLKPGSQEVVTRPVHVHEHLPPMIFETEEAGLAAGAAGVGVGGGTGGGYTQNENSLAVDTTAGPSVTSPQASPQGGLFKRPGDPVETPAAKRARLFLEEEGRPLREISSVMMTTGGFLSPAREGKLPEAKVVLPTSDSRSISPQPSSYPSVPPEVNREKKAKKVQAETAKPEKKEKKKLAAEKCADVVEEPAVKKLASMKEMEKLKALKTGALKMAARYGPPFQNKTVKPGSNKIPPPEHSSEKTLIQKLSESPHLVVTPVQPNPKKQSPPAFEKSRDSGVTIAKLTTEPDVQKLNIFKKITKVKEEKVEKLEKHDFADMVAPVTRERSPGLIIEEVSNRRPRSALSEMMESLPKDKKESRSQPKPEPRTPDISQIYEDTLSSPGSPSTPKTPEIMRKVEKSPEHKKKKKDKEKKKRKGSPKERPKVEQETERSERPKTPEILDPSRLREALPPPVLPFFPHFPSRPGLIPPPITNPLIPRFPHPLCPNFPNLPLPPPLLMQQHHHHLQHQQPSGKSDEFKKDPFERMSERSGSGNSSPIKSEKEGKSPLAILLNRDKEKKLKEHKKEKKDREKIKKKKEKKEKLKKEKGERKHKEKEEKHKEHKSKEKKDKKKEKLKESSLPLVVSVPKLTLKLGPSSPRPASPDPKLKRLLSRPAKGDDPEDKGAPQQPVKREPTPEMARISSLFAKPPKASVTKPLHVQTEPSKGSASSSLQAKEPAAPVMKSPGTIIDKDGNKVWICPACGRPDDGSAMIGCDECDAWYHWVCVGIQVPPDKNEDWYCRFCIVKKQGTHTEKKKRGRKKKPPA